MVEAATHDQAQAVADRLAGVVKAELALPATTTRPA
jgi:hypothetical protein